MSETNMFSGSSGQTVTVVSFVLALLALAFSFFTYKQLGEATAIFAGMDVGLLEATRANVDANNKRFEALEAEIKAMKDAQAAAAAAAPAAEAAEGGE